MSQNTATRGVVKATGYGAKAFIAVADAERGIALVEAGAGAPAKRDREPRVTDLWSLQSLARNPAVKAFAAAQGHTGKLSVKPLEIYLSTGFVDPQLVTLVVKLAISSPGNRKPSEGSFSCFVSAVPGAAPHATPLEAGVRQRQGWFYPPSAKLKS